MNYFQDARSLDIEVPRVERTHPDIASECHGNINCIRQNSENPVGAMWFGPRLGRRRRSDKKPQYDSSKQPWNGMVTIPGNEKNFPARLNGLMASKMIIKCKSVFHCFEGNEKRQETTFTPRLGRELADMISVYDMIMREEVLNDNHLLEEQDQLSASGPSGSQSQNHAGRDLVLVTPRLENEIRNLLRKFKML